MIQKPIWPKTVAAIQKCDCSSFSLHIHLLNNRAIFIVHSLSLLRASKHDGLVSSFARLSFLPDGNLAVCVSHTYAYMRICERQSRNNTHTHSRSHTSPIHTLRSRWLRSFLWVHKIWLKSCLSSRSDVFCMFRWLIRFLAKVCVCVSVWCVRYFFLFLYLVVSAQCATSTQSGCRVRYRAWSNWSRKII